jgi:hypothetical protein
MMLSCLQVVCSACATVTELDVVVQKRCARSGARQIMEGMMLLAGTCRLITKVSLVSQYGIDYGQK